LVWLCRRDTGQPRRDWWIPPLVFALWANLHGSFVIGWLWLVLATASAWLAVWPRAGKIPATDLQHADLSARRLLWGLVLALAAVWINPYGGQLPAAVLDFAGHPNLRDLSEWQPLRRESPQGQVFLGSLALIGALSLGRAGWGWRRGQPAARWWASTPAWLVLSGVLLAIATLRSARFIVWWGPIGGLWLATLLPRPIGSGESTLVWRPRLVWWLFPALAWGLAVGRSPIGIWFRTGQSVPLEQIVDSQTPLGIGDFLHEHAPPGRLFCPIEWGDYLQWRMPQSERHPILFGSHVHLLPADVWHDYLAVVGRQENWPAVLDRLRVETVVLDHAGRSRLIAALDRQPGWQRIYTDELGAIFRRHAAPPHADAP
jgi:hypothetical protein